MVRYLILCDGLLSLIRNGTMHRRAKIAAKAEDWPWSSYAIRKGYESQFSLSEGPVELPSNWNKLVHGRIPEKELKNLHNSINRGAPLGEPEWAKETAGKIGLESCLRPRGRPQKGTGHL